MRTQRKSFGAYGGCGAVGEWKESNDKHRHTQWSPWVGGGAGFNWLVH